MPASAAPDRIDLVAHALSDGTRRGLLQLVRDEERPAGELAAAFPQISRPAVSQHLRLLREAGLVSMRPEGNRRLYRAEADGLRDMGKFIDGMWTDRLVRLQRAAERAERAKTGRSTSLTER